ncbi:MAG: hypothetical protein GY765_04085 [bacterium]|nr:hypothetical protein [bacterium]
MLINHGFVNLITAKYKTVAQRRRRGPALTLLFLKPAQILVSRPPAKVTVCNSHVDYNLQQKLSFNIALTTRTGAEPRIFLKAPVPTAPPLPDSHKPKSNRTLRHREPGETGKEVETLLDRFETRLVEKHALRDHIKLTTVNFSRQLMERLHSSHLTLLPLAGISKEYETTAGEKVLMPHLRTAPPKKKPLQPAALRHSDAAPSPIEQSEKTAGEIIRTLQKSKESLTVLNTTTVFKPLLSILKQQPGVSKFKGMISPEILGQSAPAKRQKQEPAARAHPAARMPLREGKLSEPPLKFADAIHTTMETMKKTVAEVERKVNEEITVLKKSYPEKSSAASHAQAVAPAVSADINQLTDRVYRMLERKIKSEKERRGW